MTDTELWQAWRERGDAEAFTALVERYLDMVYATARRILGNTHDAEDVAQDCFIALLKGRVKVKHPLGPWLHRVARNRALDRIKGETRRRERQRAWQESTPLAAESSIDDILQYVDEAIDALPKELRAAVVGRFLEGQTNNVLGQRAGVAESTIRLRVSRGVEEIRATLAKRGVITTAAALGALLEENLADAAPAGLRASIAKLTMATPLCGNAPLFPRPVPLTLLAAGLLTVAGLLVGGVLLAERTSAPVVTVTTAPNDTSTEARQSPYPAAEVREPMAPEGAPVNLAADTEEVPIPSTGLNAEPEEPTSTVSGTIYNDRGYPLPGATVTVVSHGFSYELAETQVFRAITGADGTYKVDDIHHRKSYWGYITTHSSRGKRFSGLTRFDPPNRASHLQVWVTAEGYRTQGEQNVPLEAGGTREGVDFTLSPGVAVRGRVIWPDGQPLKQAAVVLHGSLDFRGSPTYSRMEFHTTGENGEFLLGLDHEGEACLQVISANGQPAVFSRVPAMASTSAQLTMPDSAAIAGTVRHADGAPLVHARVTVQGRVPFVGDDPDFANQVESHDGRILAPVIEAIYTDEHGNFRYPVFAAVPDAVVSVWEPLLEDKPQSERLLIRHIGPIKAGQTTSLDIVLPGAGDVMTIAASVVGETTGEPLPHTNVYILREGDEKGTHLYAGFEPPYYAAKKTLTKPGVYAIWPYYNNRPMEGTRALYGRKVPWTPGSTETIIFRIPEPFTLSVQVVDPSGNPIPEAEVAYVSDGAEVQRGKSDEEGRYVWGGFAPGGPGYMRAAMEGYTTNEFPAIIGEPGATYPEQTIVLLPTGGIEGIVLHIDGTPIANAYVQLEFTPEGMEWLRYQEVTRSVSGGVESGADGTFVWLSGIPAVPGSVKVSIRTEAGELLESESVPVEPVAGAVLDLGTLVMTAAPPGNAAQ